jgi:hypothetical protein
MSLPEPQTLLPLPEATLNILLILGGGDCQSYGIVAELRTAPEWFEGYAGFDSRPADEQKRMVLDLYQCINLMRIQGLIAEIDPRPIRTSWEELRERPEPDQRHRHWKITPYGRSVVQAEVRRLEQLVKVARARGFAPEA